MTWKGIYLPRDLLESQAFAKLNGSAIRVLLAFYSKRVLQKHRRRKGRDPVYSVTNNGEIEFTYAEAKAKYGLSCFRFREARDRLVSLGFIDIAETGAGLFKAKTLYSISDRWREFGTAEFKSAERERDPRYVGFLGRHKVQAR